MALKEKSQRRQNFGVFKDYGWHYDYFQNIIIMVYTVIKDWVYMQINNMTKLFISIFLEFRLSDYDGSSHLLFHLLVKVHRRQ